MMAKILIVDDEKRVGVLVKNLIHWDDLNMECVGLYDNGLEALEGIRKDEPDIVITDVRMPQMSGLELIQMSQKRIENREVFFIVISGYKEFEYAHKALEFGVENYLLKPINEEELNTVLEKINQKIEVRNKEKEKIEKSVEESNKIIRRDFLKNIIDQSKERVIGKVDLKGNRYRGIDIKFDYNNYMNRNKRQDELLVDKVYQVVEECFKDRVEESLICEKDYLHIYCLINYQAENTGSFYQILNECVLRIKESIMGLDQYQVTIGVGAEKERFEDIRISIRESYQAVCNRLRYGVGRLIYFEDVTETEGETIDLERKIREIQDEFVNAIDTYSGDKMICLIRKTMDSIERHVMDMTVYYTLAERFVDVFFLHTDFETEDKALKKREILGKIQHTKDIFQMRKVLTVELKTMMENMKKSKEMQSVRPIRVAIDYIENHYASKLSLDDIAGLVDLNPVYFSTLFKKETGVNFSAYLAKIRMEHAKKILVETNDTISAIGIQVGYEDQKYFSQAFKKIVGIKPAAYRKIHS